MKIVTYLTTQKIRNIIIFLVISIIALHTLYFIHVYGVNVLVVDDLPFVSIAQAIKNGDHFWNVEEFVEYRDQRPIFPNLILIVNMVLASWNVMYQLYFGWLLIVLSIIPMYSILKKTDHRLIWIIIPITAFMFNTAQHVSLLMDIASRQMLLGSMGIIFSIYFINKIQSHKMALLPATLFAIVASFSAIPGLLVWIVGVLSLTNFDKTKKMPLLIWLSSAFVVFFVYFANFSFGVENKPINPLGLFTLDSLKLFLLSASNGLIPKFTTFVPIQIIAGLVVISLIIVGPIYLRLKQKEIKLIMPWIQFGLIGLFYAVMTIVARADLDVPLSHYVTIDKLSQISALIIAAMIFLQIHNSSNVKYKKTIVSIFSIFVVIIVISLSTSYVSGWYDGFIYHKEKISYLECMTNPIFDFKCTMLDSERDMVHENGKMLKELRLGPFANQDESQIYLQDPLLKEDNWKNMRDDLGGFGAIEYIDSMAVGHDGKILVNKIKPLIDIAGWGVISKNYTSVDPVSKIREILWIKEKNPKIDAAYVFIDNKIHTKAYYGQLRSDISETHNEVTTRVSGWNGIIDLHELSDECHYVSIRLVIGNQYYEINNSSQICIN